MGHEDENSNFYQLLKDKAEDNVFLAKWLQRSQKDYPQIQNEQESICLYCVDNGLKPNEEFIDLYSISDTTGKSLAVVV